MSTTFSSFPAIRMRRLRRAPWIRDLVQEYRLDVNDLILPVFVIEGKNRQEEITALPGVKRHSVDHLIQYCKQIFDLGIPAVALFPCLEETKKDSQGSEALNPDNLICRAIQAVKAEIPGLGVITDAALDPYTDHGHDGILKDGIVLNDETADILSQQAVLQARAGADVIAPSDMMDGRIGVIRQALDSKKLQEVILLSYTAKYASSFYGPFREAVGSAGLLQGDKKTYQMHPANADEALREAALDIGEGADILMVKPGLPYLDVIRRVKETFKRPVFAYHVSGEYAMLKAAAEKGWIDYETSLLESMLCFKRAGSDAILTYGALDLAGYLQKTP